MPLRPTRPALAAGLALCAGLSLAAVLGTPSAGARAAAPARPAGERVSAVSHSAITVTLPKVARATRYRLYVATSRGDLAVARLGRAHHSPSSRVPRLTVRSLPYTTARYWIRVRAMHGSRSAYGGMLRSVVLRPATPTGLAVTSSAAGTWLRWRAAVGYRRTEVAQATNAAMTAARRVYAITGTTGRFTPPGVVAGRRHWWQVRVITGATASAWSAPTSAVVRSRLQPVRVMTYNVLTSNADGTASTGGATIAPWAQRRSGVLSLIRRAAPDILCVQEGGGWVGTPQGYGGRRQVDDLVTTLGSYTLARTETPPSEHHYQRFGNYVLFRSAVYRAVGAGGSWSLGEGRTAAYQLLQHRGSGARVLAVSVHLVYGNGRTADDQRAAEARRLLAQAGAMARATGTPVVYAGDFNSVRNRNHVYDGPGEVMSAAGVLDARNVAQSLPNLAYNSANLYLRTPPRVSQSIDYVFAPPGVAVSTRAVVLDLVGGRFPGVIPSDHNPLLVIAAVPY